jgi:high-affinity nickel-transport protein
MTEREYPGFDTASSIAILAISAIAKHGPNGQGTIKPAHIIILPVSNFSFSTPQLTPAFKLLFTAGMTLIDSLDSIMMLYSYTGFPERRFTLFVKSGSPRSPSGQGSDLDEDRPENINMRVKMNAMSGLSIILTLMSILVAFGYVFFKKMTGMLFIPPLVSISLITIMGLIGEECTPCREAAEDGDNHSLAAMWWRAWARANEQSGYIGAAIVGAFLVLVLGWYCIRWCHTRDNSEKPGIPTTGVIM